MGAALMGGGGGQDIQSLLTKLRSAQQPGAMGPGGMPPIGQLGGGGTNLLNPGVGGAPPGNATLPWTPGAGQQPISDAPPPGMVNSIQPAQQEPPTSLVGGGAPTPGGIPPSLGNSGSGQGMGPAGTPTDASRMSSTGAPNNVGGMPAAPGLMQALIGDKGNVQPGTGGGSGSGSGSGTDPMAAFAASNMPAWMKAKGNTADDAVGYMKNNPQSPLAQMYAKTQGQGNDAGQGGGPANPPGGNGQLRGGGLQSIIGDKGQNQLPPNGGVRAGGIPPGDLHGMKPPGGGQIFGTPPTPSVVVGANPPSVGGPRSTGGAPTQGPSWQDRLQQLRGGPLGANAGMVRRALGPQP
jgi:hypothetical protein